MCCNCRIQCSDCLDLCNPLNRHLTFAYSMGFECRIVSRRSLYFWNAGLCFGCSKAQTRRDLLSRYRERLVPYCHAPLDRRCCCVGRSRSLPWFFFLSWSRTMICRLLTRILQIYSWLATVECSDRFPDGPTSRNGDCFHNSPNHTDWPCYRCALNAFFRARVCMDNECHSSACQNTQIFP